MAEKSAAVSVFAWEGTDKKGKKVKGESKGASVTLVKADLRRQGISNAKVKKKGKSAFGGGKKKAKIITKDIAIFMRQLATMMSSGVPLVQSFEIIGKGHDNPAMREVVLDVKGHIEGGSTLAESLAKHPLLFDLLTVNLISAGEQAGILEGMLGEIATYKEKTEAIKSKVKKALTYPAAIVVVAFVITSILMIFVIPQFEEMFKGFGAELPALTAMVVSMSKAFVEYWWAIFGGLGAAIYTLAQTHKRSQAFRDGVERLSLKLPVVGDILNKAALARFARTLSTMFAAGVPLVEAMDSVAGAVGNIIYRAAVLEMKDGISTGTSLTSSMEQTGVFPNMVVQMTSIGEEAGSLDTMLAKVADFYEAEVDDAVDNLSALLEPLIMAVLGGIVGTLVIAMYLPIFKMGEVV